MGEERALKAFGSERKKENGKSVGSCRNPLRLRHAGTPDCVRYSLRVELLLVALGRTRYLTDTPIGTVCRDKKIRNDERTKRNKR